LYYSQALTKLIYFSFRNQTNLEVACYNIEIHFKMRIQSYTAYWTDASVNHGLEGLGNNSPTCTKPEKVIGLIQGRIFSMRKLSWWFRLLLPSVFKRIYIHRIWYKER